MFARLVGQDRLKHYFIKILASGKMPHSFLLYGPEGVGKTAAALELAQIITCYNEEKRPCGVCASCVKFRTMTHPDVMLFFPVPGSLKPEAVQTIREEIVSNPYRRILLQKNASLHIDMVREIKHRLRLQSYQGRGRVIVLLDCESLTIDASNALLKILEEPPPDVTMILTTTAIESIIPTVRSRCQPLQLSYLSIDTISEALYNQEGISAEDARYYASLSGGSYTRAAEYFQEEFKEMTQHCSDILQCCCEKPLPHTFDLVNIITEKHNLDEIKSILELLIALLKQRFERTVLEQSNQRTFELFKLPESFPILNTSVVGLVIDEIENSVDLLNKNVYLNLVLIILFFRLRKILRNE